MQRARMKSSAELRRIQARAGSASSPLLAARTIPAKRVVREMSAMQAGAVMNVKGACLERYEADDDACREEYEGLDEPDDTPDCTAC